MCVCDEQSCDSLASAWPKTPGQAFLVETTRSGDRFKTTDLSDVEASNGSRAADSKGTVKISLKARRQTILGWGGAFTDAASINIRQLRPALAEKLLESYYGADGLSYNFGRVPIGGSDFSTRAYSYDDARARDYNLTQWALADEDIKYKIPLLRRASAIVNSTGETLKLFASPWSPPRWMKSNHNFIRGHLIDEDRVYRSYANYLVKFFEAYRAHGLRFWGATVQNEPVVSYSPSYFFNSLQLSNEEAVKLIPRYLGPALESKGYTKANFKLMVGDDSLGFINLQVPRIMKDEGVQKYVSGLAFHWYTSGRVVPYDSLTKVVEAVRGQIDFVLMTEACTGSTPGAKRVDLGSWERGEAYAADIIEDLRRETAGWIDWNLALDERGGPNWAENFVDSPIIVKKGGDKFYKQPMYYTLAHFSRFFRPKSVYTNVELSGRSFDKLMFAAVQNEESGHVVVNILNKAEDVKSFSLVVEDHDAPIHKFKSIQVQPKSMSTLCIKL